MDRTIVGTVASELLHHIGLVLRPPTLRPRLRSLPVLDPLVLDPPCEPLPRRRPSVELRLTLCGLGDNSRVGRERREKLALAWAREEDERPAHEGGLVFRWGSVSQVRDIVGGDEGFSLWWEGKG